jgi:hypothetical protein
MDNLYVLSLEMTASGSPFQNLRRKYVSLSLSILVILNSITLFHGITPVLAKRTLPKPFFRIFSMVHLLHSLWVLIVNSLDYLKVVHRIIETLIKCTIKSI